MVGCAICIRTPSKVNRSPILWNSVISERREEIDRIILIQLLYIVQYIHIAPASCRTSARLLSGNTQHQHKIWQRGIVKHIEIWALFTHTSISISRFGIERGTALHRLPKKNKVRSAFFPPVKLETCLSQNVSGQIRYRCCFAAQEQERKSKTEARR